MNIKMISSFVGSVAFFMVIIALLRYFIDGSLDSWVWWRSMVLAVLVAGYNVYKSHKRGAFTHRPENEVN